MVPVVFFLFRVSAHLTEQYLETVRSNDTWVFIIDIFWLLMNRLEA